MKLLYAQTSPYVRKVMLLAHEAGIADRITITPALANPVDRNADLAAANPLGKVPALVLDDGRVLFDSRVIVAYLDSLHDGAPFTPAEGPARFEAMTLEALSDGILDAALLCRYETVSRPAELYWAAWYDGQMAKIVGALDVLERDWIGTLEGPLTIGQMAVAAALCYLDFRFKDAVAGGDWRDGRPKLAAWLKAFSARPSMVATEPS